MRYYDKVSKKIKYKQNENKNKKNNEEMFTKLLLSKGSTIK